MRRFALGFALVVFLAVGAMNYIDSKYPNSVHKLGSSLSGPASAPAPAPQVGPATPRPGAASANAGSAPLDDFEVRALWPGANVERVVYGARPYVDMTVVSITPQTVVLRNEHEIVSIPTGSLPDELRVKAIAYLNGTDGPPYTRAGAPAFPITDSQPQPQPSAEVLPVPAPADGPVNFQAVAWQAAHDRAERWLRFERERRLADIVPLLTGIDLRTPMPVTGLPGYWKVRGRGYVATHQTEKGGTFHDFEITVVLDSEGNVVRADIDLL